MNRQPIGYLEWFLYAICYVFLHFYNKELALNYWFPHMSSKHTQTPYQPSNPHIHAKEIKHNTLTNIHPQIYHPLNKIITLSLHIITWLFYGLTQYIHDVHHQSQRHHNIQNSIHNKTTFQHPPKNIRLNRLTIQSLILALWLSPIHTTNQVQYSLHNAYFLQNKDHNINHRLIPTIMSIPHTHPKHHMYPHTILPTHHQKGTMHTNITHNHTYINYDTRQHNPNDTTPPIHTLTYIGNMHYITQLHHKNQKSKSYITTHGTIPH